MTSGSTLSKSKSCILLHVGKLAPKSGVRIILCRAKGIIGIYSQTLRTQPVLHQQEMCGDQVILAALISTMT